MEKNKHSIGGHKCFQLVKGQHKWLLLTGMLIISLSLSGCKKPVETDAGAETNSIKQAVSETTNSEDITEMKTIDPPEDGWTHEQLSEVMYLCGKPFSLPCKLEDLLDDFEIGKVWYRNKDEVLNLYITVDGQDSGFYQSQLLLDGEDVGLVFYYETEKKENVVFGVEFYPDICEKEHLLTHFVINGCNQESSFEEVKKSLGNSIVQDDNVNAMYDYKIANPEYPDEYVRILSFDEEEVLGISYHILDKKKKSS